MFLGFGVLAFPRCSCVAGCSLYRLPVFFSYISHIASLSPDPKPGQLRTSVTRRLKALLAILSAAAAYPEAPAQREDELFGLGLGKNPSIMKRASWQITACT